MSLSAACVLDLAAWGHGTQLVIALVDAELAPAHSLADWAHRYMVDTCGGAVPERRATRRAGKPFGPKRLWSTLISSAPVDFRTTFSE